MTEAELKALDAIEAEFERLSTSDKMRLAAALLEMGQAKIAHAILRRILLGLGAALSERSA